MDVVASFLKQAAVEIRKNGWKFCDRSPLFIQKTEYTKTRWCGKLFTKVAVEIRKKLLNELR